ncbi:cation diffusion facilitator family transporter [Candidatus Thiodictyon syntrophicum]|jgi:cobalt-zinc-cadmium efflux system protein|uniref:Cation transporter n=1 Tax=Candidatus Thiodictyon syntrophicum TaxID=1166950 RepID=A0A2K8UF59_9GAMM|nr:cation diffusion facilitator family transporter [Candidatus Thiodictyon syntrophicum]AUB84185.1 cation transporter [Candidatus Thiodictyon syntrophicum]
MSHAHHHHAEHQAQGQDHTASLPALRLALILTLGYALVEAAAGWWSGSLALLADAGHMVTDAAALGLAGLAAWLTARPPSPRHSYGLGRAESLAALINAAAMLAVVVLIAAAAWGRLQTPRAIDGLTVSGVAVVGLAINLVVAWVLARGEPDLNVRGALLHVMGDALGSVAAIVSGLVIWTTGWTPIDPLLSLLICGLILSASLSLLSESLHTLLDGVPGALPLETVGMALARVSGVAEVHDLHIWSLSSRRVALSAHVRVPDLLDWPATLEGLCRAARALGIEHVTFQPEPAEQPVRWGARPSVHPAPAVPQPPP